MPTSTQESVLFEIRNARTDLARLVDLAESILGNVRGLYRRSGPAPRQPNLPGLAEDASLPQPGAIARSLPRKWSNTVKVYDALWEVFGDRPFGSEDLFGEEAREAVRKATNGRIKPQTVARMMTALRRARAAGKVLRSNGRWFLREPTDALREAVEAEADRLNAHAAKEAADA